MVAKSWSKDILLSWLFAYQVECLTVHSTLCNLRDPIWRIDWPHWCILMHTFSSSCRLAQTDAAWPNLTQPYAVRAKLVQPDPTWRCTSQPDAACMILYEPTWPSLTQPDVVWPNLTQSDPTRRSLTQPDTACPKLTHPDAVWVTWGRTKIWQSNSPSASEPCLRQFDPVRRYLTHLLVCELRPASQKQN